MGFDRTCAQRFGSSVRSSEPKSCDLRFRHMSNWASGVLRECGLIATLPCSARSGTVPSFPIAGARLAVSVLPRPCLCRRAVHFRSHGLTFSLSLREALGWKRGGCLADFRIRTRDLFRSSARTSAAGSAVGHCKRSPANSHCLRGSVLHRGLLQLQLRLDPCVPLGGGTFSGVGVF